MLLSNGRPQSSPLPHGTDPSVREPLGPQTPTGSDLAYELLTRAGLRADGYRFIIPGIRQSGVSDLPELCGVPALCGKLGTEAALAGSGGVFAPSLFVGAMLGGACASLGHQPVAAFVVVGMAAVFAGAAHVPIATMMMVTEMTGGYTLLVPAALAVLLSYLVQTRLAAHVKYQSIYEAQVKSRADSPAHHAQHLRAAFRILREEDPSKLGDIGELDLVALVRSGIRVELADHRRLLVGVLRPGSALVGTTIAQSGRTLAGKDSNIIGVVRGNSMCLPHANLVLEAGDHLILIGDASRADLSAEFDPW